MKNRFLVLAGAVVVLAGSSSWVRAEGFKEGKWSMTMVNTMDKMSPQMAQAMKQMQNLPPQAMAQMKNMGVQMAANGQGMTITANQCLTRQNPVPQQPHMDPSCQPTHHFDGNTVSFAVNCSHGTDVIQSNGTMTYNGDNMEGHIKSHVTHEGQTMDSSIVITGKYEGPC